MPKQVTLVYGHSTSGKTTLGRKLVHEGLYDAHIEIDDLNNIFGKRMLEEYKKTWRDPEVQRIHKQSMVLAGKLVNVLLKDYSGVVVTGVWKGTDSLLKEQLQQWDAVVLAPQPREVARERWIERNNKPSRFDLVFSKDVWDENSRRIMDTVFELASKDKLNLSDDLASLLWEKGPALVPEDIWFELSEGAGVSHKRAHRLPITRKTSVEELYAILQRM